MYMDLWIDAEDGSVLLCKKRSYSSLYGIAEASKLRKMKGLSPVVDESGKVILERYNSEFVENFKKWVRDKNCISKIELSE